MCHNMPDGGHTGSEIWYWIHAILQTIDILLVVNQYEVIGGFRGGLIGSSPQTIWHTSGCHLVKHQWCSNSPGLFSLYTWWRHPMRSQCLTLRLYHTSGSPWILPFCNPCGNGRSRPSSHPSWYIFWWCPCIVRLVFLWVSHLLPPCTALFLSYVYHLYVFHAPTLVVVYVSDVLLSVEL